MSYYSRLLSAALCLALCSVSVLGRHGSTASQHVRKLAPKITVSVKPGTSISADGAAAGSSGSFQGDVHASGKDGGYILNYKISPKVSLQVKSNPRKGVIEIRKLGNKADALTSDDKQFLTGLADVLEGDGKIETNEVDEVGTQSARAARLLAEWPDSLDMNFDYSPETEESRTPPAGNPVVDTTGFPKVPPSRNRALAAAVDIDTISDQHHYRKLAYTSLCSYVNTYYEVTHDDYNYNNWADQTTFWAWLSMDPVGPCSGGTYFWKDSAWKCYTPDHDANVEYAYGACFGRCGADCGSSTQFTKDCANHDSCVRFGHSIASLWCNDEFSDTADDALFAPNC